MMRGKRVAVAIMMLAAGACNRHPASTVKPSSPRHVIAAPDDDSTERDNLLNYARGAVVVARSGEFGLWASAIRAIDGDPNSCWVTPPHNADQWVVAALPTESRVEQIGMSNAAAVSGAIASVTFESSMDGVRFAPLGTVGSRTTKNGRLAPVRPVQARYVRATLHDDTTLDSLSLCSLQIRGAESATRSLGSLTGCWTLNGSKLTLAQDGDHLSGRLDGTKPTLIEGGSDGRFVRFVWVRDREFGYGGFSVEESGQHLSGRIWHEEPIPMFAGDDWFGERSPCSGKISLGAGIVAGTFFQRKGRFPLYGLRAGSDGTIDVPRSAATLRALGALIQAAGGRHVRLEAHEFRQRDAASNRLYAGRELASLRALLERAGVSFAHTELAALGSDQPRQTPRTEDQRALYSAVEVVVTPAKTLAP